MSFPFVAMYLAKEPESGTSITGMARRGQGGEEREDDETCKMHHTTESSCEACQCKWSTRDKEQPQGKGSERVMQEDQPAMDDKRVRVGRR